MSTFDNAALSRGSFAAQAFDAQFRVASVHPAPSQSFQVAKRIVDVVVSLIALIALALPAAVIALLIKRESEGPILAKQTVVGRNGQSFTLFTFRSTHNPALDMAESDQTRVGVFLHATGLTIIPEFINVLLGDMSLVGPRPVRTSSYRVVAHQIPGFTRRLAVRPGMTGLAQIKGVGDLSLTEELAYDHAYITTSSLVADAGIAAQALTKAFTA